MLENLRARMRQFSIPAQLLSMTLRFIVALLWVPMWYGILTLFDTVWYTLFHHPIGTGHWIGLWVTAGARVVVWTIDEFLNLDEP